MQWIKIVYSIELVWLSKKVWVNLIQKIVNRIGSNMSSKIGFFEQSNYGNTWGDPII